MEGVLHHEKWFFGYVSRKFIEKYLKNPGDWCVRSNCRKDFGRITTEHFVCVKKSDGQIHDYVLKFDKRKGWYFGGTESEIYPSLERLLHSKTETIQKLQLVNAAERPSILIPPGSLEWENCDANLLGKGSYGTVIRAKATINKVKFDVAVKIPQAAPKLPKPGSKRNSQKEVVMEVEQMLHEAEVMRHFHHENILRCFGIDTSEDTIRLVLSLCPGGSLLEHLRHNGEEIRFEEKLVFSLEAARGLKYLHMKWKCIHRDMAARNCLIAKDGKLKLSDFGICMMEGITNTNEDKIKVPIPWLAPECLTARPRFSTKSDVFSFAIFMYEIITNGQKPWPEHGKTEDIMRLVRCGKRMNIPSSTHKGFQQIISACWAHLPYGRPEIWEVVFFIRRLLNSAGIPKPEHRSLAKLSKSIIAVPFTEDPEDFELDECSPPPTSEEMLRMDRITQERQKRLQSPHAPSADFSSDDLSSDFHGHLPKHKNRTSRKRITSNEPMSRQSDNSSSAEFRGKNRSSQSDRPRPSRSSNSKPPTLSARKSLNIASRPHVSTARRVSTPSKLSAPRRSISSTQKPQNMRTARGNANRRGSTMSAEPMETNDRVKEESDGEYQPEEMEFEEIKPESEKLKIGIENSNSFKRFELLLKKTENFSKKLSAGDAVMADPNRKKRGRPTANDHRHRLTEEDEDNELMEQEDAPEDMILFDKSPSFIKNGELRDYQVRGLNWLIQLHYNKFNGILADEMGLGKTLQTVSLLGYMKHVEDHNGPFLVIVPKSTIQNWKNEFTKWCPTINTCVLIGNAEERAVPLGRIKERDFDVVITSYEMVLKCMIDLKKVAWYYLVIDEAHRIKNENSKLAENVRILKTKNRLLLTGTPLQNNLHELWALLNFLLPEIFNSAEDFDSWFHNENLLDNQEIIKRLHRVLQPFLLRRIKADVEKSLLPKKEVKVFIGLSRLQKEWYTKILMKDIDVVNTIGKLEKKRIMNLFMHLRKCCNHPYLFDGAEPGPPYTTDKHLVESSGKMVLLDKLLAKLEQQGSRVLIFSQMSRMLDILEDYCVWRGYKYCRLDGQTAHDLRQSQIDEFNREGSEKFLFMLTTRAGGLGINLTSADVVILFDSDWNPQIDLQAMDRAHRIGQKKQVRVFRFVTENTCEERIIERAERKLRLDSVVIQQGRLTEAQKTLGADEMISMIKHGANTIFSSKESTITDEDIDAILEKSEDKTNKLNEELEKLGESNLRDFKSIYEFEGENYKGKSIRNEPAFLEPPKRERKTNYNMDQIFKEQAKQDGTLKPGSKAPRPKSLPQVFDFQFYPKRLYELVENELYFFRRTNGYMPTPPDGYTEKEAEKYIKEEKKKMDKAMAPTDDMIEERDHLINTTGFDWSKKEFNAFVKACEKYESNDYENISKEIGTRDEKEVEEYAKVFWKRGKELKDFYKYSNAIEKGRNKLYRKAYVKSVLERKYKECRDPYTQLDFVFSGPKGKSFSSDEDRFILCKYHEFGCDDESFEKIRQSIRSSPQFKFDWFFISRTSQELAKRCAALIASFDKDANDENVESEDEKAKKRPGQGSQTLKPKKKKV